MPSFIPHESILETLKKDPRFVLEQQVTKGRYFLALQIYKLRTEKNLTLRELAGRSGIRITIIKNIESGLGSVTIGQLEKILRALDVSLEIGLCPLDNTVNTGQFQSLSESPAD